MIETVENAVSLKAPFPYFGGKRRVASVVWEALGDCDHYLEPFFGSGAVLLSRKNWRGKTETVCDKDGFVANAWRAIQFAPDEVAKWCDWPINHTDFIARRKYLKNNRDMFVAKLNNDPDYYDAKKAGFWIWGSSCGIGVWFSRIGGMPDVSVKGKGIHRSEIGSIPAYLKQLHYRLRKVRVVCGDWTRVCGGNWQDSNWPTVGIFFDPPYGLKAGRTSNIYNEDSLTVADAVAKWSLDKGKKDGWRIVLAGYYDEHAWLLEHGWSAHRWVAHGGYASFGREGTVGEENRLREALFFSPHCLKISQPTTAPL